MKEFSPLETISLTFSSFHQVNIIKHLLDFLQAKDFKQALLSPKEDGKAIQVVCSKSVQEGREYVSIHITLDEAFIYSQTIRCGFNNFLSFLFELQGFNSSESEKAEIYWKLLAVIEYIDNNLADPGDLETNNLEDFRKEWILKLQSLEDKQVDLSHIDIQWDDTCIYTSSIKRHFLLFWGRNEASILNYIRPNLSQEIFLKLQSVSGQERIKVLYDQFFPEALAMDRLPEVSKNPEEVFFVTPDFLLNYFFDLGHLKLVSDQTLLENLYHLYKQCDPNAMELVTTDDVDVNSLLDFYLIMLSDNDVLYTKTHFQSMWQQEDRQAIEKHTVLKFFSAFCKDPTMSFISPEHTSKVLSIKKVHLRTLVDFFSENTHSLIKASFGLYTNLWIQKLKTFYAQQQLSLNNQYFYDQGLLCMWDATGDNCVLAWMYPVDVYLPIWSFFTKLSILSQIIDLHVFEQVILPSILAIDIFSNLTVEGNFEKAWLIQRNLIDYLQAPMGSEAEMLFLNGLRMRSSDFLLTETALLNALVSRGNHDTQRPLASILQMALANPIPDPNATIQLSENIDLIGLARGGATSYDNNCSIDVFTQQVNVALAQNGCEFSISDELMHQWAYEIKRWLEKNPDARLSLNDIHEVGALVNILQLRLAKHGIFINFTLELYWVDGDGKIALVDNNKKISDSLPKVSVDKSMPGFIIELELPIRVLNINTNHYEPLFEKKAFKRKFADLEEYAPQKRSSLSLSFWDKNHQDIQLVPFLCIPIRFKDDSVIFVEMPLPNNFEEFYEQLNQALLKQIPEDKKAEFNNKKITGLPEGQTFEEVMESLNDRMLTLTISENENVPNALEDQNDNGAYTDKDKEERSINFKGV